MIRKFLLCLCIISIFLGYVAQKVNLVRLSYEIDHKEKIYREFLEEQKHLRFKVAYLKSPKRLDAMMEAAKINFQLPREIRIVKLMPQDIEPSQKLSSGTTEEGFGNWLNWIKEAQAKTTRS
ncbi:MAG: hypothetical protein HZC17_10225 [Candidatus Omnitrophica bacterium]|nr:hypothetical protein [Candidatus Omnitrophota bacterium]